MDTQQHERDSRALREPTIFANMGVFASQFENYRRALERIAEGPQRDLS